MTLDELIAAKEEFELNLEKDMNIRLRRFYEKTGVFISDIDISMWHHTGFVSERTAGIVQNVQIRLHYKDMEIR